MPPVPSEGEISPLRSAAVEMTGMRAGFFYNLRPLKGRRLTAFCASLALLQNVFAVHRRAPPSPSAAKPLSPPERSDAQIIVSRFPCGNTTRRRQAATTFGPKGCQPSLLNPLNLRAKGASDVLTLHTPINL